MHIVITGPIVSVSNAPSDVVQALLAMGFRRVGDRLQARFETPAGARHTMWHFAFRLRRQGYRVTIVG